MFYYFGSPYEGISPRMYEYICNNPAPPLSGVKRVGHLPQEGKIMKKISKKLGLNVKPCTDGNPLVATCSGTIERE